MKDCENRHCVTKNKLSGNIEFFVNQHREAPEYKKILNSFILGSPLRL
jgi:hypothetical protein